MIVCTQLDPSSNKQHRMKERLSDNEILFTQITKLNAELVSQLRKLFPDYKIQGLKHRGETPYGKKYWRAVFDREYASTPESQDSSGLDLQIAMHTAGELIGFADISIRSRGLVDIPLNYGSVNEFFIIPKHRRKGYGMILYGHVEQLFAEHKVGTVLLTPDPVTGVDFWRAMGYEDTGLNKGSGQPLVYRKHLAPGETAVAIDDAISKLRTPTQIIAINPYNKRQLSEMFPIWKAFCLKNDRRFHKRDVKSTAFEARKHRDVSFAAIYYGGGIVGFVLRKDKEEIRFIPDCDKSILLFLAEEEGQINDHLSIEG